MELKEVVSRFAEGLRVIDETTDIQNSANPETSDYGNYLKGVACLGEDQFRDEFVDWWNGEFSDNVLLREIKYPENGRWKCDIGISQVDLNSGLRTDGQMDWAIELKYIRFIGDNGKVNNYGLGKVVSPYKAEHSSVGDAIRLSQTNMAKRKAIVMYGFEFDGHSEQHCRDRLDVMGLPHDRADAIAKTIRAGTHDGQWELEPVAPIYEAACNSAKIQLENRVVTSFSNLLRHPNYRMGKFLAWELK